MQASDADSEALYLVRGRVDELTNERDSLFTGTE